MMSKLRLMMILTGIACCQGFALFADEASTQSEPMPLAGGAWASREIDVLPSWRVGTGSATLLRPAIRPDEVGSHELIVHFHGAVDAVRRAMERDCGGETVLLVTMPGLSAAYSQPFRDDPALFESLLGAAWDRSSTFTDSQVPSDWERITLSSFSAGYGAIREILRSPAAGRIDAIVAADSIYAGLDAAAGERRVSEADMAGFLAFARRAVTGSKVFVIAHSAQPTPYASTTETADYLLAKLRLRRGDAAAGTDPEFMLVSRCERGGFLVTGYAGESAAAHLHHLRIIDRHWADARRLAGRP
ncbi:MAG: hypothetical protein RLZZ440_816 [Planctomycetota bacterium]|jgi:hypothetical protein